MDPVTIGLISGGILGGSKLLGGLMGAQAEREAERQKSLGEGAAQALKMGQESVRREKETQQSALADIIAAYRSGLGG